MVCAHGGDTTHAPPNTVSAFRASLAAGADCVEVDAALSRDRVLVVMHVRELGQLLGRKGVQVGDMLAAELLALRWASGEAVMSVEEAVRLTAPFVSCVTLDVKTYNDKDGQPLDELEIAESLVGLVQSTRCSNCMIWAKSDRVVRRVLELSPGQRTGYIVMNETEESRQLGMQHPLRFSGGGGAAPHQPAGDGYADGGGLEQPPAPEPGRPLPRQPQPHGRMQPAVVGVHHAMVEPELLEALHGAGKQLFAWTVNQAEVLRAVLDVGVDALVTNYPLTALAAIDSRMVKCGAINTVRLGNTSTAGEGLGGSAGGVIATGDYL